MTFLPLEPLTAAGSGVGATFAVALVAGDEVFFSLEAVTGFAADFTGTGARSLAGAFLTGLAATGLAGTGFVAAVLAVFLEVAALVVAGFEGALEDDFAAGLAPEDARAFTTVLATGLAWFFEGGFFLSPIIANRVSVVKNSQGNSKARARYY